MTVYYNENEPAKAHILRALMAEGLIAQGDVDERSIRDVKPTELRGYTQCHFFAGIGGWSIALRLAGWDDSRPVWTGSCPCQPFSNAGKRRGRRDARHLWPVWCRLIAECGAPVTFGEQVASHLGRDWFSGVRSSLEAMGRGVGAADLCAASLGAPHIRQRLFWVADAKHDGGRRDQPERGSEGGVVDRRAGEGAGGLADPKDKRLIGSQTSPGAERWGSAEPSVGGESDGLANAQCSKRRTAASGRNRQQHGAEREGQAASGLGDGGATGRMEHADSGRAGEVIESDSKTSQEEAGRTRTDDSAAVPDRTGPAGGLGNTTMRGRRIGGDEAQPGSGGHVVGTVGAGLGPWSDTRTILCRDGKARRVPLEPAFFPLATGLPGRVHLLRGAGDSIVPQVAAEFIKAVEGLLRNQE